jgi:hypothetical protein
VGVDVVRVGDAAVMRKYVHCGCGNWERQGAGAACMHAAQSYDERASDRSPTCGCLMVSQIH